MNISNFQFPIFRLALCALLLAFPASAGDITKGYTFTPTDRVTSTKLNGIVDDAVINSTFITGKSVAAPDASDSMVFYSAGAAGLRKATLNSLFLQNSALITGQTEDTAPVTGDYVLTYDVSATALKKATLLNLVFTNAALINGRTNWPTPDRTTTFLLAYDTGTGEWSKLSRSNLFWQMFEFNTWTNQPRWNAPSNSTALLPIFDAEAGTNKTTTFQALLTNLPAITTNAPGGFIYTETNGTPARITWNNFSNYVAGGLVANVLPQKFVSTNLPIAQISAAGKYFDTPHGLSGTPQSYKLVAECITADLNYSIGDQVVLNGALYNNAHVIPFCNTTNIGFITDFAYSSWQFPNKTTFSGTAPTSGRWVVKIVAEYFP